MTRRVTQKQITSLQQDVLGLLNKIESLKYNLHTHDYKQLNNHLQYAMTTLRNITNLQSVENADPMGYNTVAAFSGPRVQYNKDGTTKIVQASQVNSTGEGWEQQFDQNTLINPPCYVMPPQSLTSIDTIRRATACNRVNRY